MRLPGRSHATVARQVARKAWRTRGSGGVLRRALVDLVGLQGALLTFGTDAMITDGGAFFPLSFLPAYRGPHFHRAVRRLLVPGAGPFVAHLSLTGACPWTCAYCFASAGGPQAHALGDGEDFELIFTVSEADAEKLRGGAPVPVFEIGEIVASGLWLETDGERVPLVPTGWAHDVG